MAMPKWVNYGNVSDKDLKKFLEGER